MSDLFSRLCMTFCLFVVIIKIKTDTSSLPPRKSSLNDDGRQGLNGTVSNGDAAADRLEILRRAVADDEDERENTGGQGVADDEAEDRGEGPSDHSIVNARSAPLKLEDELDDEIEKEISDRQFYDSRSDDFVRLHDAVHSDLSAVSSQLKDLQEKSREIDDLLEGRKATARSLDDIVSEIIIPPDLIILIRDTMPGDAWLSAIVTLEEKIESLKRWKEVKAAEDAKMVMDGLKAKAISSLRTFLLNMIKPIRTTVKTNIQMIQSSILLKYLPFFAFLRRQAPKIANEIQRNYINSARAYYETSFRRYARSLGQIKARSTEKFEVLGGASAADNVQSALINPALLAASARRTDKTRDASSSNPKDPAAYANLTGDPAIRGHQAEDGSLVVPSEAIFRSILLAMLDNGSSEFTFLVRFFRPTPALHSPGGEKPEQTAGNSKMFSPSSTPRPLSRRGSSSSTVSFGTRDELQNRPLRPMDSMSQVDEEEMDGRSDGAVAPSLIITSEALKELESLWRQVLDSSMDYCQALLDTILEPLTPPPTISLMSMIHLNDIALAELGRRGCTPLESTCFAIKLKTWPMFQKQMDAHIDSVKKLADAASSNAGGFAAFGAGVLGRSGPKDQVVREICQRYGRMISALISLSSRENEMTVFAGISRLRAELARLVDAQVNRFKPSAGGGNDSKQTFLASLCEAVQIELDLNGGQKSPSVYSRLEEEMNFWKNKKSRSVKP